MLRTTLRLAAVAVLGATLIAATPTPTYAAVPPTEQQLATAAVAVHHAAQVAVRTVRVVAGHTSWGLAASYCGSGALHTSGVSVRSPQGTRRAPAAIWPGDTATISCAATSAGSAPQARTAAAGGAWVAPLSGPLYVSGDCRVGGQGLHYLAQRSGHLHQGVDFSRAYGTQIRSIRAGTVRINKFSYNYIDRNGRKIGAGWYVLIDHGGGVQSVYMHMAGPSPYRVGARVATGAPIGRVGNSGSYAYHLHFQVHTETWTTWPWHEVNPSRFLRDRAIPVGGC